MCTCVKDITANLQFKFEDDLTSLGRSNVVKTGDVHLSHQVLSMAPGGGWRLYTPAEGTYRIGKQPRKWDRVITFSYCPFCGVKLSN